MGPPDWHCPWGQREPANSLPDCCRSLSCSSAHMIGEGRSSPVEASLEASSWSPCCRPDRCRKTAFGPAPLSCCSKMYWGRFSFQEMTPPMGTWKKVHFHIEKAYCLNVWLLSQRMWQILMKDDSQGKHWKHSQPTSARQFHKLF